MDKQLNEQMDQFDALDSVELIDSTQSMSGTEAGIATIREAYAEKINAAIDADNDDLVIELSREFRMEAFDTLSSAGSNAARGRVA